MAEIKRRTMLLNSGKQIKLFGNSIAIGKSLEIGEGYAPNIFSITEAMPTNESGTKVSNPHRLTQEDLMEIADFNIQLWMDLKNNLRKFGPDNPKIFSSDPNK